MTVIHTSDWHLTEGPRFADVVACLEHVVVTARAEHADLILVLGDLTGQEAPHEATIPERLAVAAVLQDLGAIAPVVVVEGNHEALGDLRIYERLRARHPIYVVDRPTTLDVGGARVFCLPYPRKSWAVGRGLVGGDLGQQKGGLEGGLRAILAAWRLEAEEARAVEVPTVFAGHLNIAGSHVGGGEVILIGQEVELSPHDLDELGVDYAALGHIHLRQQVSEHGWYCGTPACQTYGEASNVKGLHVVEVLTRREPQVVFVPTPARRFVTLELAWTRAAGGGYAWNLTPGEWTLDGAVAGAEVRVRVTLPEEALTTCPLDQVAAHLTAAGAHAVQLERVVLPHRRSRLDAVGITETVLVDGQEVTETNPASEAWAGAVTAAAKLAIYWQTLGERQPPADQQARCLEKLAELEAHDVHEAHEAHEVP